MEYWERDNMGADSKYTDKKERGMSGSMQDFAGKPNFSWNWVKDLKNFIHIFETLSRMTEVMNTER